MVSEYPQLATYFFAPPHLVPRTRAEYRFVFSLLMALALFVTALVATRICTLLGHSAWRTLMLLLPATLYFSLNRFDVLAACICLVAVWLLLRDSPLGYGFLGVTILSKIYPRA